MTAPALELTGILKSFGPVRALDGARLTVRPGEIHALLGENGAGKSTLVSIAAGWLRPDSGAILSGGIPLGLGGPRDARAHGIALVPQHDLLVDALSVADNMALFDASAPFWESRRARRERFRRLRAESGFSLPDPDLRASEISVGERQRVELASVLARDPRVLILDEPTAVLSPEEARALFSALRRRRASAGRSVVLITHRVPEVFEAADRLTLLSKGRTVFEEDTGKTNPEEVAARLLGATGAHAPSRGVTTRPLRAAPETSALALEDFRPAASPAPRQHLQIAEGEIAVLLAIDGNGAGLFAAAAVGLHPAEGTIRIRGRSVATGDHGSFRAAGGRFIPGDRRAEGLVQDMTLAENLWLGSRGVFLDPRAMRSRADAALRLFGVRARGPEALARELSGGNQQRVLLARELVGSAGILVAIHPTRGLDIASTADVRRRLVEGGRASSALVVTSDPEEAALLATTIRVVYRGALTESLPPTTPSEVLGRRMAGLAA